MISAALYTYIVSKYVHLSYASQINKYKSPRWNQKLFQDNTFLRIENWKKIEN